MLPALLLLLQSQPIAIITPNDMRSVEKVGAICRAASEASAASGKAADWLSSMRRAGEAGGLSLDDQTLLVRMCGVYAVASREAARRELEEVRRKLDN